MFLLQAVQAPFVAHLADEKGEPKYEIHIPRYTLRDAILWGAVLTQRWRSKQVENLSDNQVRDFNTMYPEIPATLGDIKRAVQSMEGAEEVITTTVMRGKVYECVKYPGPKEPVKDKDGKPTKIFRSQNFWKRGKDITSPTLLDTVLETILGGNGPGTLVAMGWEIADVVDKSAIDPPAMFTEHKPDDADESKGSDPLPPTEKQG